MVMVWVSCHPKGLHPLQAAKAWHLAREEGMPLRDVCQEVVNMQGGNPGLKGVWDAVKRIDQQHAMAMLDSIPLGNYKNCGRKRKLTRDQEKAVVAFVKRWRSKRFCICNCIRAQLKLKVDRKTIGNTLNRYGYYWNAVPKVRGLSEEELQKRKVFVDTYLGKHSARWESNMNLVLDGVTLTKAPKPLTGRQRHMAQSITFMWVKDGEKMHPDTHTFNRYGVQLGIKVPLWGGFTGGGQFTLRQWTPRPKMLKSEWAARVPALKRAVESAGEPRRTVRAKVWHDNERFLLQPKLYHSHGLQLVRFPPNSGDLNPIENVWAQLRKDLAKREQDDFATGRTLSVRELRSRVAQILQSYSVPKKDQQYSYLQKLVRGMPARLHRCQANRYGRCGK